MRLISIILINKTDGKIAGLLLTALVILILLVVIPMLLYTITGGGGFEISLPNGYSMVRTYGNNIALCEPPVNKEVVGPFIDGYAVYRHVVVGHVTPFPEPESVPGYFIVDTTSGKVWKGLTEKRWLSIMRKYGINKKPRLRRPIRPLW